ncbi:TPA: SGNH/GDSL hydrolase family protein [Vibrio parahaemolyticus]|uniref:SGNH/GDSL hydrolase family protein n=1 Tax=Vibrio parahaemolyticus TaxID=670 RepID=UPI0012575781|nr:SGNH/GDSL hydrolase family protein [Vibrio parahaemolyticus]VVH20969.1 long tail fiber protein [Vibrio phage vB_VpaM_VP-3212]
MHPLQNGSQTSPRPANKPIVGGFGYFTESGDNNVPSYPGADYFNHQIDEFLNLLSQYGVAFTPGSDDHLVKVFAELEQKVGSGISRFTSVNLINLYRFSLDSLETIYPGQKVLVKVTNSPVLLSSFVVASSTSGNSTEVLINDGILASGTVEFVLINQQLFSDMARNKFSSSPLSKVGSRTNNLVILGDSITEGVGASQFSESYIHKLSGGFSNKMYFDFGGVSYPSYYNMATALSSGGVTSTGTLGYDNVSPSRDVYLSLDAGESIKIQWRNLAKIAFTYSDASSCSISISVNGSLLKSLALSDLVWGNIPYEELNSLGLDLIEPVVDIVCTSGSVRIRSLHFGSHINVPKLVSLGRSGRTFSSFTNQPVLSQIYDDISTFGAPFGVTTLINLGTNSIYSDDGNENLVDYIASLQSLIDSILVLSPNSEFVISIPPQSDELLFQHKHEIYNLYVSSILSFCEVKGYSVLDLSDSLISRHYDDGIHPNDVGHSILATLIADRMNACPSKDFVKWNNGFQRALEERELTLGAGWQVYQSNDAYKPSASLVDGLIRLNGALEPSGSGTTTLIASLPASLKSYVNKRYVVAMGNGFVELQVSSNGDIIINTNPDSLPFGPIFLNQIVIPVV